MCTINGMTFRVPLCILQDDTRSIQYQDSIIGLCIAVCNFLDNRREIIEGSYFIRE